MDGAYHGHTRAALDLSPYKFDGPGGSGRPPYVHVLPCPDPYRGEHLDGRKAARAAVAEARAAGGRIAAFFSESVLSCGGQIVFPDGYLADVYDEMRQEGAVCIADEVRTFAMLLVGNATAVSNHSSGPETWQQMWSMSMQVQTGFGRAGSAFWAFETQVGLMVTEQRAQRPQRMPVF